MFGQVREDAAVELDLFGKIEKPQRVFVIASGGCTAFTLLGERDDCEVYALDISQAQIALVELKTRMFETCGFDAARYSFAHDARSSYRNVQSALSPDCRALFDRSPETLKLGLNNAGTVDQSLKKLASFFFLFVHSRKETKEFLQMISVENQQLFYQEKWCNWQWNAATAVAFNRAFLSLSQFRGAVNLVPSDFSTVMRNRFARAFAHFPNATNPYLWQTFFNQYPGSEDGYPLYLQSARSARLVKNLPNLKLKCADALVWLKEQTRNSLDLLALSNILELLPPQYAVALMPEIIRCARPGAFVCVRSIFPSSNKTFQDPSGALTFEPALSEAAEQMDRSQFCNFIQVYKRN